MTGLRALADAYLRNRHAVLFYSLLLTLGAAPILAPLRSGPGLLQGFLAVNLLAAVLGTLERRANRILLPSVATAIALRLAAAWLDIPTVSTVALALWAGLALLAAAATVRFALRGGTIDAEHLYAALSAYLLAGVFCGVLYWVVERAWPGSLTTAGAAAGLTLPTAIYFSFVTLATLGYGDIVPASNVARGIAIVEAVAAQLYLAVMVARLVSLYVLNRERE